MSNKEQSSIEWLQEQLECFGNKHELQMSWATVDELIESFNSIYDASIRNIEKYSGAKYGMKDYWQEVKQEIEKL